ncbi:unnamed protein product [Paramecium sonneborni]|uniref:Uncharacterized protein n=1 Tax=Paramecium sonneborni TaxID=65129 RepID=A0A8S1QYW2_9CILI|nr:unnamed protein product [Paramecium sonneborni]
MGSVCINQSSSYNKDQYYPIIKKQLNISPNRQCFLEKPLIHSELLEDTQDLTQLENILEDVDVNNKIYDDKIRNEQITVKQEKLEQVKIIEVVEIVTQNINRVLTQTRIKIDLKEENTVIQRIQQGGQDNQTIKSILKTTHKTKSSKSVNIINQKSPEKKVSFGYQIQKQKPYKFYK